MHDGEIHHGDSDISPKNKKQKTLDSEANVQASSEFNELFGSNE